MLVMLAAGLAPACLHGQERPRMPWYDAEAQRFVPVGLNARAEHPTDDRSTIPLQPPAPNPGTWNGWGGNWSTWVDLSEVAPGILWSMGGAFLALLLGLVAWLIWRYGAYFRREEDPEEEAPRRSMAESIQQLPFEMPVEEGDFRELARQAHLRGELKTAVVYLFSHVLVALDQRGLVRLKKGKTNRQYLRELPAVGSLSDYYRRLMLQFERSFFGDHAVEAGEFERHWDRLDEFESAVRQARVHSDAS